MALDAEASAHTISRTLDTILQRDFKNSSGAFECEVEMGTCWNVEHCTDKCAIYVPIYFVAMGYSLWSPGEKVTGRGRVPTSMGSLKLSLYK